MGTPPPWRQADTPLARAFSAAFDRLESSHLTTDPADEDVRVSTLETRGLAFVGLDLDHEEAGRYVATLAAMQCVFMDAQFSRIARDAEANGRDLEGDEVQGQLDDARELVMRGEAQIALLAGALYGVELGATTGPGRRLPGERERDTPSTGDGERETPFWQAVTRPGDPRDAYHSIERMLRMDELKRDSVQAVIDLQADYLDRLAPTLATLGLESPAELCRSAAALIRAALEGA